MVITQTDPDVSPGTTNLDIIDLKFTDFGTYTCVASLKGGGISDISIDVNISSSTDYNLGTCCPSSLISKLFFDVALEEQTELDTETLQNEKGKVKAQHSVKEKKKWECRAIVNGLWDALDMCSATIELLWKLLGETERCCSSLKKQVKFLEKQQEDNRRSE
ncbi:hypothetical protein CIB84_009679 [Bambusicola thoracicus]|uniref:Immunoglobulin I-set domain-containing protein n=1 Tax=Bambusicola thoracicus TaxID=9083 RepID=A0A2P4SR50_BAMTH|nr:hypothetical protein CIB84_009679 [Bambusicola thoracicus]